MTYIDVTDNIVTFTGGIPAITPVFEWKRFVAPAHSVSLSVVDNENGSVELILTGTANQGILEAYNDPSNQTRPFSYALTCAEILLRAVPVDYILDPGDPGVLGGTMTEPGKDPLSVYYHIEENNVFYFRGAENTSAIEVVRDVPLFFPTQ